MGYITRLGLLLAWTMIGGAGLSELALFSASANDGDQPIHYDYDRNLDFQWIAASGSFAFYNVYVSVDGGEFTLAGETPTESYTLYGEYGHSYRIKVAAVTFDGWQGPFSPESDTVVCSGDGLPPETSEHLPAPGAVDVPIDTNISFHVADSGDGVDQSSIVMTVDGLPIVTTVTGNPADYLVTCDPPQDFDPRQTVTIAIDARDLHSPPNVMSRQEYEFTTGGLPNSDPAASDPNVFFYTDFEDGNLNFQKWDVADNFNEIATGDLAIVEGNAAGCGGSRTLRLGTSRVLAADLVKHFSPTDTVYCRLYVRFAPDPNQENYLRFLTLAGDSTGELYKVGDVKPQGDDYFRSSLDFKTDWGRQPPPGEAILSTYHLYMKPRLYDDDGDGYKDVHWPANEYHSDPSVFLQDDGWHCMEMMLRVNTPGLEDGEQAFWIDGELVGYWSGLTWRLSESLRINCLWLRLGVPEVSPSNHVWIDNVALSTRYIGPADAESDRTPVSLEELSTPAIGHTSAEIAWGTSKPSTSILLYGEEGGFSRVIADTSLSTQHQLRLKGLKPNTEYRVRIISRDATGGNEATSGDLLITTLPSTKGVFTEAWGNTLESEHPGTVEDTYISIPGFSPDGSKESPVGPCESPTLCAYTFPTAKPAAALLMRWDLSAIPPNAEILDAKLCLFMFEAGGDPDYSLSAHQVVGVDPVVSEATGYWYKKNVTWSPFPGLHEGVALAQSNIAPAEDVVNVGNTVNQYCAWTVTKMVARWVVSAQENHGLIVNPESPASAGSYRYFRSSSFSDPSQRPFLVVTCRTSRGQTLYWEEGSLVIQTDPFLAEQYTVQSNDHLTGLWKDETAIITSPWWRSGNLGETRMKFFRMQTGP